MDELVKQMDSYHLFNYLVPGVVGTEAVAWLLNIRVDVNVVASFFIFYFAGLVISRIGSIAVEPILKLIRLVHFEPYSDYLKAAKKDDRLELMSQENNTYRTYTAMCITIIGVFIYSQTKHLNPHLKSHALAVGTALVAVTILMGLAYRKQTGFVTKRIRHGL